MVKQLSTATTPFFSGSVGVVFVSHTNYYFFAYGDVTWTKENTTDIFRLDRYSEKGKEIEFNWVKLSVISWIIFKQMGINGAVEELDFKGTSLRTVVLKRIE